jgi:hypothetical protein
MTPKPKTPTPPDPAVRVTFTVTVEMTLDQRNAYSRANGVENVGGEVAYILRPTMEEVIRGDGGWLGRLADNATITVSRPEATAGLEYNAIVASGQPTGKGGAP